MDNKNIDMNKKHTDANVPVGFEIHENAIPNCDKICSYLEEQQFNPSLTFGGLKTDVRNSSSIYVNFTNPYHLPETIFNMNKIVWDKMIAYAKKWNFPISTLETISIQKYDVNEGFYQMHHDGEHRVVSALVYLNDVDSGGETVFPEFDFKIKPDSGKLAIFPSNFIYRHAALPPKSNIKIAAAYWAVPIFQNGHGHGGHNH